MGWGNRQADAGAQLARRQAVMEPIPCVSESLAAPDAVLSSPRLNRHVNDVVRHRMKYHRIAVIASNAPTGIGLEPFTALVHIESRGKALIVRNSAQCDAKIAVFIL